MTSPSSPSSSRRVRSANRGVAALLTLAVLLGVAGADAAPPAISLATWTQRLDAARQQADAGAANPSPAALDTIRALLGLPVAVSAGGRSIRITGDAVLDHLSGRRAQDFQDASDELAALEDAARLAAGAHRPDARTLGRQLALAYRGIKTKPSFWDRVRHDVWVVLLTVLQHIESVVSSIPLPPWLIALFALVIIGLAVVLLIRRARMVVPEQAAHGPGTSRAKAPDWDKMAEEALARGDLDGAVRARYRALLAALAARGVVPAAQSLTAGECRRAVSKGLPDLFPAVAQATQVFESAIYGHAPIERTSVETLREATQKVKAA